MSKAKRRSIWSDLVSFFADPFGSKAATAKCKEKSKRVAANKQAILQQMRSEGLIPQFRITATEFMDGSTTYYAEKQKPGKEWEPLYSIPDSIKRERHFSSLFCNKETAEEAIDKYVNRIVDDYAKSHPVSKTTYPYPDEVSHA